MADPVDGSLAGGIYSLGSSVQHPCPPFSETKQSQCTPCSIQSLSPKHGTSLSACSSALGSAA